MLRGDLLRTSVYVDRETLALLKVALALDEMSMSAWFRQQARVYIQAKQLPPSLLRARHNVP